MMHTSIKLASILCLCLLVIACGTQRKLPDTLEKYHQRLFKVMELEYAEIDINTNLNAPNKTDLRIDIADLNIKIREFYAIEGCNLKPLIAQRNTGLGKLQLPSNRLNYEWRLIDALRQCESLENDELTTKMREKVRSWRLLKEHSFSENWANMVTQSDESYLGLTQSPGFIDGNESDNFAAAKLDLQTLVNVKVDPNKHLPELELTLKSISEHRLYARLWRSQRLTTQYLNSISPAIKSWGANFSCSGRKQKEQLKIIRNVFNLFFVQEFQQIASQVNNYHYQLSDAFTSLKNDRNLPPQFSIWLNEQHVENFDRYQRAIREHVTIWQDLFKKCD